MARFFFRGIYFPQMGRRAWVNLFLQNRRTIYGLVKEGVATWRAARKREKVGVTAMPSA
jgi:hypothetical protein